MPDTPPTSAACCLVHHLGKCDAVFTCCDRCPTFFADRAKPIYGKPFHGWSCDCDECKGYDERGEPRPGEAPRPQASAATIEALFRRLAARGYFEVSPGDYSIDVDCPGEAECDWAGSVHSHSEPRPGVCLTWAPKGQAARSGPARWNPFCTRSIVRPTLQEALTVMEEATRPRWGTLEDNVWRHRYEHERREVSV